MELWILKVQMALTILAKGGVSVGSWFAKQCLIGGPLLLMMELVDDVLDFGYFKWIPIADP